MAHKLREVGQVILGWAVANLLGVAAVGALSLIPLFLKLASIDLFDRREGILGVGPILRQHGHQHADLESCLAVFTV